LPNAIKLRKKGYIKGIKPKNREGKTIKSGRKKAV